MSKKGLRPTCGYRRRTAGIILFCLLLAGFTGFGFQDAAAKEVSFTVFYHFTPEEARGIVFREVIKEYNKEHAGRVKVELSYFADWLPLQQKTRTMTISGSPPDVFYFNYNPNDLSYFESGQLLDFIPYMDEEWKQRFFPSDLADLTYNGKLLAIPVEKGPICFIYNQKLLKKAGMEGPPQTWDEFFAACEALKTTGITPVSLFTSDDAWHATNFFSYFAAGLGGEDVFTKTLDSPEVVAAAELLQKVFQYTTPDAIGGKWAVSVQNFLTERTAVLIDGPWVIGMIEGQMRNPKDVVIAPAPTFKKGDSSIIVMDAVTPWVASKHLSNQQQAAVVAFLKHLTSEKIAKRFAVEGKMTFAVKMNMSPGEITEAGPLLARYVELANEAEKRVLQITRRLKPAATQELQSLIERLVMKRITPGEFVKTLQRLNS